MKRIVLFISLLLVTVGLFAQTAIAPAQGDGSINNPYQIATWQNLYWLSQFSILCYCNCIQTADIDLSTTDPAITTWDNGAGWSPITISFSNYNGNGKIINGLFINRPTSDEQGLFSTADNGTHITNLGLLNVNVTGADITAALVGGIDQCSIINCYCTGTVSGNDHSGGLIGNSYYSTISNCYSNVYVHGTGNIIGGLVGANNSTVINSFSSGSVRGYSLNTGGLIGNSYGGHISDCYSTCNVIGVGNVGGFLGNTGNGEVTYCYSTGIVTGTSSCVGGFIGNNGTSISYSYSTGKVTGIASETGGLAGSNTGSITKCYSTGEVIETFNYKTGGLVGNNIGTIVNSYSTGNVRGHQETGGLVGYNNSLAGIFNCYSVGNVNGHNYTGGLVAVNNGYIGNCYSSGAVSGPGSYIGGLLAESDNDISHSLWDITTSGQTTSAGGIGKTTAEMKMQSTYTAIGWIFPTDWNINPTINNGYPYLNYADSVSTADPTSTVSNIGAVLHAAYPNPFNPSTTISFDVHSSERISINIYNVKGQLVKNICNQMYNKGYHSIIWNGKDNKGIQCGTGVYFYKMQAGKVTQTQKMMMIK